MSLSSILKFEFLILLKKNNFMKIFIKQSISCRGSLHIGWGGDLERDTTPRAYQALHVMVQLEIF